MSSFGPTDVDLERSRGNITGQSTVWKFGANAAVGATLEVIWSAGGAYTGHLAAASTVQIQAGGNAADTAAGAGAQTIRVFGLDSNWDFAEEVITTAGAAASTATTTVFWRIYRIKVETCGTRGASNTGVITIEDTGTSSVMAIVDAAAGQTAMTPYTIPAGKTGYLTRIHVQVGTANSAEVRICARPNADVVTTPFSAVQIKTLYEDFAGSTVIPRKAYGVYLEKTDIWFDAKRATGVNAQVSIEFDLILVDN